MIDQLYSFIELHYTEFIRQSKLKLNWKHCEDKSSHIELVQTVLTSFLEKLNKDEIFLMRMYKLLLDEKLFLYLIKSVDINAKFSSGPYLRNKYRHNFHKELDINLPLIEEDLPEFPEEDKLIKLMNQETFTDYFGKYGYFYFKVFTMYGQPNQTYKSIADYYKISKSSVASAIMTIKQRLQVELSK